MKERTLIMDAIFEERQRAESAEKRIKELEEQIASPGFIPHGLNVNENDTYRKINPITSGNLPNIL